jgi:hypothetical protein
VQFTQDSANVASMGRQMLLTAIALLTKEPPFLNREISSPPKSFTHISTPEDYFHAPITIPFPDERHRSLAMLFNIV